MSNPSKDGISAPLVRLEAALSRLDALINWEKRARSRGPSGMEVSLAPIHGLCASLGSPERALRAVHVAGSKGKGTTATWVASALTAAGLRVGCYRSPHVACVTERLTIGAAEVDPERFAIALERALDARDAAPRTSAVAEATWFDVLTAASFLILAEERVELAVIECGLGGRLDSTNVVHGTVAAITNIYLEHTQVLGTTRAAIAAEKAGIIKPGARVVVGALGPDDEAERVIADVARARGASLVRIEHAPAATLVERNRRFSAAILRELERAEPELARRTGGFERWLSTAVPLPGRAERRRRAGVRVVLDGAHVPESLELLLRDLSREPELGVPPVVVFGCRAEKNAHGMLKALAGRVDRVFCSSVGEGPNRDAAELADLARTLQLDATAVPEPAAALDEAVKRAGTGGWVLVTGSLHLVGALRGLTQP